MNINQQYLIPASIVIAGALIATGIFFGGTYSSKKQAATIKQGVPAPVEITSNDSPFIGNPKAKLTIYYWSDFQCPFCKQFESISLQSLIKEYVSTNKVKVVFKDLQFLGQDSADSAFIARGVWELYPDKYYAWREGYFAKQDEEGDKGFGDRASVIAYTKTVTGIDTDKVIALIDKKKDEYQQKIQADHEQATGNSINGTPGVIVGDTHANNPLNYQTMKSLVESQLK